MVSLIALSQYKLTPSQQVQQVILNAIIDCSFANIIIAEENRGRSDAPREKRRMTRQLSRLWKPFRIDLYIDIYILEIGQLAWSKSSNA